MIYNNYQEDNDTKLSLDEEILTPKSIPEIPTPTSTPEIPAPSPTPLTDPRTIPEIAPAPQENTISNILLEMPSTI